MVDLQNDPSLECFYMVADGHTITTPFDPDKLGEHRYQVVLDYLAIGLNPERSVIFLQSQVPEHFEFAFYLSSLVSVARMRHLPTFKEKVKQYPENVTMALLNYPVLMAADILVYKASLVPVGIDQEPHLEVARQLARKLNSQYNLDFPEPERFATKGEYVPSLTGQGKMSKSVAGSYLNLTDNLEEIADKLAKTPTDSGQGDLDSMPDGVQALLTLAELFEGERTRKKLEAKYVGSGLRYLQLKERLAQAIYDRLLPIQERRQQWEAQPKQVESIIARGAEQARSVAADATRLVREKLGLG